MDSWLGHSKQELIMKWGPPARTASDGGTGEILVYAQQVYIPPSSNTFYDNNNVGHTTYNQGVNYWDYKMFYVNSDSKIYYWMVKREQIPPTQIDLNIYRRY